MKFLKCIFVFLLLICLFNITAFAKSEKVTIDFDENNIKLKLPSDYIYFTARDIDKSSDYFNNMPIDKNEAIEQIRNGTYLDAFSEKTGSQITLKITSDKFSEAISNFSPMDDNDKQSVINNFKSTFEQNGHSFLSQPKIIEIDGYNFIEFNCRVGTGENAFSYKSVLTIIGGNCYEIVCYNKLNVPDDETNEEFSSILSSVEMNIKGEFSAIVKSFIISAISIIVIIAAVIIIISMIYSLIKEFISHKNHSEKVKLKKR